MNKMPLINTLFTFYSSATMRYVGQNWRGTGYAMLFILSAYCAIFVTYSWNNYLVTTYQNHYRPVIKNLPAISFKDDKFVFDAEMPQKLSHPLTDEKIIYIDTTQENLPKESKEYSTVILKDKIIFQEIPSAPLEHTLLHTLFKTSSEESLFKDNQKVDAQKLLTLIDSFFAASLFYTFVFVLFFIFITELSKTIFITFIVMFMFRKIPILKGKSSTFSLLNRLCILTYMPVLILNAVLLFFFYPQGIILQILTSFCHIILFLKAIHANSPDFDPSGES